MPIVSHTTEITVNADGSQYVIARYYDQDGQESTTPIHLPAGVDADSFVVGRIPEIDDELAKAEFEELING